MFTYKLFDRLFAILVLLISALLSNFSPREMTRDFYLKLREGHFRNWAQKFSLPIKLEQTGISADTRETTQTKIAQVHGLDSKFIVLWGSRIYLQLVHSLIFSVDAFSGWFTNKAKFGDFFRFHGSAFSGTSRSRETLLHEADKYGEQKKLANISCVLACSCSQGFCHCPHARNLVKIFCREGNPTSLLLELP